MNFQELQAKVKIAREKALNNPCKRIKIVAGMYCYYDGNKLFEIRDWVSEDNQTYWTKTALLPSGDGDYWRSEIYNGYFSLKEAILR